MMRLILIGVLFCFQSCFLFSDFSKRKIHYSYNGSTESINVIVPKRYNRSEMKKDSAGNEAQFYYYSNGAVLYFAKMQDTSKSYQYIDYDMNLPRTLYNSIFYKGVFPDGRYWRESRFDAYKSGYYKVDEDRDGTFDSSLNYFRLRSIGL